MVQKSMERNQLLGLVLKKRVLIPVLALIAVCMIRVDFAGAHSAKLQETRIFEYIETFDPRHTPRSRREQLVEVIMREAERLEIPPEMRIDGREISKAYLLTTYIRVESSFNPLARSRSDARGYMQLKPLTASWINRAPSASQFRGNLNLYDTEVNVALGADYINYLMTEMDDARQVALAYNAGPTSVRRGIFIESYWEKILHTYRQLRTGDFRDDRISL
ncbi:MAG: transglycosylase SLT domain-containing protein [Leptospirales bacterium]|jgi:hypothetical protein